ncbi:RagB/SusD family nutrient uptake outer membrane protein [Paraflavitalea sp. CAU 1676]|uniref:RagB/SusD family nutrient uptake outer membrane protein n=1 Tax=Paraflavitalea sp. CAU 1676 TaxID=3032598 RepID=UPI0023DC6CA7|nr:RagB/SusD family nutrient uptake outer membrane protein [Paraflavitalea sp. CAU 1676]MDF2188114.1 RagB/SusD family nutrient uptake outer membrane protein [Paraflavitalea sp. CAU 1676]
MKKQQFFTAIYMAMGVSLMLGSCTKLDEHVYDQVLETSFKPTEADLPSILGAAYVPLRTVMVGWQGDFDLQEEPADIIVTPVRPNGWYDGGTYQRMHKHEWRADEWQPINSWNQNFRGINTVNRIIAQIEGGSIPVTNGKDEVIAELKAARAFYYSMLVDNHGNVPIVTSFTDTVRPKQSTRLEVYTFIEKELTEALPKLSTKSDNSNYGRMNKWAAHATLARLYLNAEVYTGTAQWQKCIDQCNEIITKGPFVLEPAFKNNFTTTNNTSKELIFAVPFDEIFATQNSIHMKTLATAHRNVLDLAAQPWGGNCAVPQFIDTYDPDDTRMKDTWIQGPQRNVRTGELILTYTKAVPSIDNTQFFDGFRIGKYEIKAGARGGLSVDYPVFRLAGIMLMKAEALLRTGKPDEAAVLVTDVRKRAFLATPAKATVTGAQLQLGSSYKYGWQNVDGSIADLQGGADIPFGRMLDELGWEFAAEGQRRQQLIRFGVYSRKIWFNHRPKLDGKPRTLFPIPQVEIDKNPNLQQNSDYR